MSRIIIQLEGGLIQDVFKTGSNAVTEAVVMDFDCEGANPSDITAFKGKEIYFEAITIKHKLGPVRAIIGTHKITKLPNNCNISYLLRAYDNGGTIE